MKKKILLLLSLTIILAAQVTAWSTWVRPIYTTVYGEMWNRTANSAPFTFSIASSNVYYNLTDLDAGNLNGFNFTDATQVNGGSYLTLLYPGTYMVDASISWEVSAAGGTYAFVAAHNFDPLGHYNCYVRRAGTITVGNAGLSCIMYNIQPGDTINIVIEDEADPATDLKIHNVNLRAIRIGP